MMVSLLDKMDPGATGWLKGLQLKLFLARAPALCLDFPIALRG